jgi:hypothetical protein
MEAAGCQQLLGGRRDYRGYGLRELLRASREETMPIDRSRIRKGMFLVLDQPLPDYIPNGRRRFTKRPSAERLPPRDSDPITAFLGHRKPSTKALRRPVETTLELDIVRRKSALRICARKMAPAPKARLDKAQRPRALRTFVSTQMAASKKAPPSATSKSPGQFNLMPKPLPGVPLGSSVSSPELIQIG